MYCIELKSHVVVMLTLALLSTLSRNPYAVYHNESIFPMLTQHHVQQAIVEDYEVKNPLYTKLGEICKPETIFASNTSSLSITAMGEVSGRPDRMSGVHFFNPVQVMKLVEVVKTEFTSDETDAAVKVSKIFEMYLNNILPLCTCILRKIAKVL